MIDPSDCLIVLPHPREIYVSDLVLAIKINKHIAIADREISGHIHLFIRTFKSPMPTFGMIETAYELNFESVFMLMLNIGGGAIIKTWI
ncbi:MAG: hypothetical protein BWY75_02061 [bacterium ADurb.Bin425]|nr:MAG: hypothetical protein BWY75_02061 [bacterium ADurb.Bin425]